VAVDHFETGISEPRRSTLDVVRRAFERVGVVFIDENGGGAGLRFKKGQTEILITPGLKIIGRRSCSETSRSSDAKREDMSDSSWERVDFPMPSPISRAEYLADFGRTKYVIGVAGSDGESENGRL